VEFPGADGFFGRNQDIAKGMVRRSAHNGKEHAPTCS
jgi:hypothetical protein